MLVQREGAQIRAGDEELGTSRSQAPPGESSRCWAHGVPVPGVGPCREASVPGGAAVSEAPGAVREVSLRALETEKTGFLCSGTISGLGSILSPLLRPTARGGGGPRPAVGLGGGEPCGPLA